MKPLTHALLGSGNTTLAIGMIVALSMSGCGQSSDGAGGWGTPAQQAEAERKSLEVATIDTQLDAAVKRVGGKSALRLPDSGDLAAIPQDPRNPLTADKVALGRMLFHDPSLGNKPKLPGTAGTYSCASCHNARFGFQAGIAQSIGEGGEGFWARKLTAGLDVVNIDATAIRAPSALHAAYQRNLLWNGQFGAVAANAGTEASWTAGTPKAKNHLGYHGTETQAIAGQDVHRLGPAPAVYQPLFDAAFPDWSKDTRYGQEPAGLAMAAYERTLLANQAPFQRWLRGEVGSMTLAEKRGAVLFFGKAACAQCHSGPSLASESFHALGMPDLVGVNIDYRTQPEHKGRGGFTGLPTDLYKFKTPQLYNLADSAFYGHGGSFKTLREVLYYKNIGMASNLRVPSGQLSPLFKPLGLSQVELDDLAVFLESALRDPNLLRYEPATLPTGVCPIHADPLSVKDLNCSAKAPAPTS